MMLLRYTDLVFQIVFASPTSLQQLYSQCSVSVVLNYRFFTMLCGRINNMVNRISIFRRFGKIARSDY